MSARLGSPNSIIVTSAAVTANGRVLSSPNAALICSVSAVWTATATIGNRTIQMQVKDAAGNIVLRVPLAAAVTASQVVNIVAVNGATIANFTGPPIVQTLPLPSDMPLPAGGSITLVDTGNIDATDTCSMAALVSY